MRSEAFASDLFACTRHGAHQNRNEPFDTLCAPGCKSEKFWMGLLLGKLPDNVSKFAR